jgi:hypothetical protein
VNPSVICTREPWCACDVAFMSILFWVKVGAGSAGVHQEDECARSRRQRRCANAHTLRLFCLVTSWCYLSCMPLVTDFTPLTALATRTAPLISARELTKPLN